MAATAKGAQLIKYHEKSVREFGAVLKKVRRVSNGDLKVTAETVADIVSDAQKIRHVFSPVVANKKATKRAAAAAPGNMATAITALGTSVVMRRVLKMESPEMESVVSLAVGSAVGVAWHWIQTRILNWMKNK